MLLCVMPIMQIMPGEEGGFHEDNIETWYMIRHNPKIAAALIMNLIGSIGYNVCAMFVTGHLGAVFRTVLETTRCVSACRGTPNNPTTQTSAKKNNDFDVAYKSIPGLETGRYNKILDMRSSWTFLGSSILNLRIHQSPFFPFAGRYLSGL